MWTAWQYIEPFGWSARDLVGAKQLQMTYAAAGGQTPPLSDFITKPPDWRAFDPALHDEMESERLVRNMRSIMRGGPSAKNND